MKRWCYRDATGLAIRYRQKPKKILFDLGKVAKSYSH